MRKHHLVPLMVLWLCAGASSAHAAVPVGDDGSLRPRDSAELYEAVAQMTVRSTPVTVVLGRGTFELDRTLVLDASNGDRLLGRSPGETRLTGAPGVSALLRVVGSGSASNLSLSPSEDASTAAASVVQLRSNASLSNAYVFVPDTTPNVTAIDTLGANLFDVEVESLASQRPALHSSGSGLTAEGLSLYGGNPTVDLDAASTVAPTTFTRAFLAGGADSTAILHVHGAAGTANVTLAESIVRAGDAEAPALVDLAGSSVATGFTVFDAQRSTFSGPPESITLHASTDRQLVPTVVTLGGVLALGSETTVDCGASALLGPVVTIAGIYRTGAHQSGPGRPCTIVETGRRSGGDPALTTDRGLRWGSPAIDAIARPIGVTQDAFRGNRTSTGPQTPALTPTDLGAVEYQYLPPSIDETKAEPLEDGTVGFSVAAFDGNEGESDLLTFEWRFADGTTATGPTVTHRFAAGAKVEATVTVTDPSGLSATATVGTSSQLDDSLPGPVDEPTPTPTPTPEPTPVPTATPQQTLPELVTLPKPSGGGDQSALNSTATVVRDIKRTSPRTGRTSTRRSGLGAARKGEAGVTLDLASSANLTVLARRRVGARLLTVPNARFSINVPAGVARLRLTSRIGRATLRPGLYRVTILVRPVKGTSTRRDLYVRVLR